jgi:guanosine-3',5'-bis(diphosphate) 3'-pyrophosphohydrolase
MAHGRDAIAAALLHDVLEDTGTTKRELAELFGKEVAELVDGLSKLDKMEFASYQEAQAENFRKMLMAMARDLRVVLIKLADRQHNLQTMAAMRPDKRAALPTKPWIFTRPLRCASV